MIRSIWAKTEGLVESTALPWRVLVCKLGETDSEETECWAEVFKKEMGKGEVDLSGAAPAVVSTSFISMQQLGGIRIFSNVTSGTDEHPGWVPKTSVLVQATPFAVFESNPQVLATALLVTEPPALTSRSGRHWHRPDSVKPCTLLVALHVHLLRTQGSRGKYPLDSQW